jgi:hypothetical protein
MLRADRDGKGSVALDVMPRKAAPTKPKAKIDL